MRCVRYSVAMSLDGYIAGPNGEFDWIPMDPEIDFNAMFKRYDALLMGRKSYDAAQQQGGTGGMGMQAYVFSKTLSKAKGAVVSADVKATVTDLKKKPGKDIWLFGGGELFRSLLALGLVDEMEVAIVPVLLGRGLPMLPSPAELAKLKLTSHRVYQKTGTVLLGYAVK
jgi:dihydrofolate reductase